MSGWYPEAVKLPIKPGANDGRITPVLAILHVAASVGPSLFNWFNGPSGGIESHFYIRRTGVVEQYRSVLWEADANYKANSYVGLAGEVLGAVSVETSGRANGRWTRKQIAAIKALLLWLHTEHGLILQPPVAPQPMSLSQGGVSYHTRFKQWSNVTGKTCPGPRRIMQYTKTIMPWMRVQRDCTHCPVHCPKES